MPAALLEAGVATIVVDRLEVLRTTPTYTLYAVYAHNVDGAEIDTRLRTFDDLPTEVPITVTLENYVPKTGGDASLTVKLPQAKKRARNATTKNTGVTDDARIAQLESRVEKLERQIRRILTDPDLEV